MSSIYSIYKATNTKNKNKPYIGFTTKSINARKGQHRRDSFNKNSSTHNTIFHKAIRKYGIDAFNWETIYQSKNGKQCLETMEEYFIKEYNSHYLNGFGYNMTYGNDGTLGYKHTEKQKKIWSLKRKGVDPWNKNKTGIYSNETLILWSKQRTGKKSTQKRILKISKKWNFIDPTGKQKIIINLYQFSKDNNLSYYSMINLHKHKIKNYKGWSY